MIKNETITIPCTGYDISADWYTNPGSQEILLCFVGLHSTKARNAEFIEAVAMAGVTNALVLDFSGHGESPFAFEETRPAQHLLEAIISFDWLAQKYPDHTINVMGTSYGGYIAAWLTRFRNFNKLVLRTPAIYEPADMQSRLADIDTEHTSKVYRKDTTALQQHPVFLQKPVFEGSTLLVIHEADESVPVETTDVYQHSFSAETYIAKGFKHSMRDEANPRNKFAEYESRIATWLKQQ